MDSLKYWARNIELRMVMLRWGTPFFSEPKLYAACEWTVQRHHQVRTADKLSTEVLAKMANGLACPVSVLLDADPSRVVSEPIPKHDWLEEITP